MPTDWLPDLETFVEAAGRASFSAAARALDTTREVVVARIRALEHNLGVPLFVRTGGRLEPTPAGGRLLHHARRILDAHKEARHEIAGLVTGDLAVAVGSVPGEYLLPDLLAAVGRMYPQLRFRAAVTGSAEAVGRVARGDADIGLAGRPPESPHLEVRRVARDRMVVVVLPDHPLAGQSQVTLAELSPHAVVLRGPGSGLRRGFETVLHRAAMSFGDLRVVAEFGSDGAVREAVLRGVGAGVLTSLVVRKDVAAGRLVALKVWGVRCDRDVYAITDRRRELTRPARLFLNLVEACPADDPAA